MALHALLWDVDGTLAETERDGHRCAFNRAFAEAGLPLHWDADAYGPWLAISGGAERIRAALRQLECAEPSPQRVAALQAAKQRHYAALMAAGDLQLRPGVAELIREASAAGLEQAIVTTSGRVAVEALIDRLLSGLAEAFGFWVCGEDVRRKKPDPEAYLQALERLGRRPDQVICLEDSPAGLGAAAAAGLPCLVSLSHYASREDPAAFSAARAVVSELGPRRSVVRGPACQPGRITLSYLKRLL
jgi:HAD superfamily hydrolase (TIGR01509 family)